MDVLWCSLFFCKRWFGQTLKISQITLDSLSQRLWWLLARQPAVQSWAWRQSSCEMVKGKRGMILSAGKVQNNWTFWEMHGNAKSPSHKLQQTMFWDCQVHLLVGFNYFRGYISDAQLGWAKNAVLHLRYILERKVSKHEKWGHEPWLKNLGYTYYFLCNDQEW